MESVLGPCPVPPEDLHNQNYEFEPAHGPCLCEYLGWILADLHPGWLAPFRGPVPLCAGTFCLGLCRIADVFTPYLVPLRTSSYRLSVPK